jgi:hypothetical protein
LKSRLVCWNDLLGAVTLFVPFVPFPLRKIENATDLLFFLDLGAITFFGNRRSISRKNWYHV